jgi:hypothetical protein
MIAPSLRANRGAVRLPSVRRAIVLRKGTREKKTHTVKPPARSAPRVINHLEGLSSGFFLSSFAGAGSCDSTPNTYFEHHEYSRRILSSR